MATVESMEAEPFAGYSPQEEKPLGGYATLMASFLAIVGAFSTWFRLTGRKLPERMDERDMLLLTVASHRAARLVAKDKVTSAIRAPFAEYQGDAGHGEVDERPRGRGLRRVVGELLVCPYCLGMWSSSVLTAGLLVAPRFTRWVASVLTIFFGADLLQVVYKKATDTL